MNKKLLITGLLYIIIVSVFASAGTLISGNTVQIDTSSPQFGDYNLLFTWSTSPAASDSLVITRNNLPAGYDIDNNIEIFFNKPEFEQVFAVSDEEPLYKPRLQHRTYWYFPQFNFDRAYEKCIEAHLEDLDDNYGGADYLPGVDAIVDYSLTVCDVRFVYTQSQEGFLGDVKFRSWNYDQEIEVGDLGILNLANDKQVDSKPNIGKATLLNFGQWVNAELSDKNIYAYQGVLESDWIPIERSEGLNTYNGAHDTIRSLVNSYVANPGGKNILTLEQELETEIQIMRDEIDEIKAQATTEVPVSWRYATDGAYSYSGKNINVPITENILTANIQFLINGDSFGLKIPLGEPEFVDTDLGDIEFEETSRAYIDFDIKNIGDEYGTFQIVGSCNSDKVNIQSKTRENIAAGSTWSDEMEITAITDKVTEREEFSCSLIVRDLNSQIEDVANFGLTVIPAESCAEGQETPPTYINGVLTVYILDSACSIKETKTCEGENRHFVQAGTGKWECVDSDGELIPQPVCGDGLCENSEGENGIYPCPDDCAEPLDNVAIIVTLVLLFILAIGIIVAVAIQRRK